MNIKLREKEIAFLKQYANVYEQERNIDITADPIVVVEDIEELIAGYGYGDKDVYIWDCESYDSLDELRKDLEENGATNTEINEMFELIEEYGCIDNAYDIRKLSVHNIYKPIAYFLTRKEAEKYVKYQSHNLNKPRIYTRSCGYSNVGDLQCLYKLLLRIGQQLNMDIK